MLAVDVSPAGTFTAFGPQTYPRMAGAPITVTQTFSVMNPNTSYTIRVQFPKGSAATIALNGAVVFSANEEFKKPTIIERSVTLAVSNTISVRAAGKPGVVISVSVLGMDTDLPSITAAAEPPPNANGWNNEAVVVSFMCEDLTSGIQTGSCPTPVSVTSEGAAQLITGTVVDKAGNRASTTVTLNIDKTPPLASAVGDPASNVAGWNRTDVTVHFSCQDSLSGIDFCPDPVVVDSEGRNQVISGSASDLAGNTQSASATLNIDTTPPSVDITQPVDGATLHTPEIEATGTVSDSLSGVASVLCPGGAASISGVSFTCPLALSQGFNVVVVEAKDVADNIGVANQTINYLLLPDVMIVAPTNLSYVNISPTTVTGTVDDPAAIVSVNSIPAAVVNGAFSVAVPLAEGPNVVTASAISPSGAVGDHSIQVTLDTTPPRVTITSPPDQFATQDGTIVVSGIVNDLVVGTVNDLQAQVVVNGASALVANRTFLAADIPLVLGTNIIQAVGRDRVGNSATTEITVTREPPGQGPRLHLISGNNQSGTIGSPLLSPLVVSLTDGNGNPVANEPVTFTVTQDSGVVSSDDPPAPSAVAVTNAQGEAQVQWTLGARAGAGSNAVEAAAVGFGGTALFTASATQGPAGRIVVDSGDAQVGVIGQTLPKPLLAVVVDSGSNRLGGIPVTFTVIQGGGSFDNSLSTTVYTDSDGRAAATLTLGPIAGEANHVVTADFPSNQSFPVTFRASGRASGDPAQTTISGVVLDNSNVPIPGVTLRAVLTNTLRANASALNGVSAVQTDSEGQFSISAAPVGFVKLMVDGTTATLPGQYPSLEYDMVTIAGQNNTVGMPIYLLPLSTANQLCVTATSGGGSLTIPEAPGFSLTFGPGQVTFPGGSKSGCIGVTVVHGDKVPMPPGFGQQPQFIVTIQPAGAVFNPPAPITLPNVEGLLPRSMTEMYSFDHDIGSFVALGTGTVSDDGLLIKSDPGVGVLKAGWHCGGNPAPICTIADCPSCQIGQANGCVADQAQQDRACDSSPTKSCYVCKDGSCKQPDCEPSTSSQSFSLDFGPISQKLQDLQARINEGLKKATQGKPIGASVSFSSLNGGRTQSFGCCSDCSTPRPTPDGWREITYQLGASVSGTGSWGPCPVNSNNCTKYAVVPLIDVRLFASLSAPNLTFTLTGKGSGSGSYLEQCSQDTCGFVSGSITLSASANAGAGAKVGGQGFDGSDPRCFGITPKNAMLLDYCWGNEVGLSANAFSSLTSEKFASVEGKVGFPLPFTTCAKSGAACTWTALQADLVFAYSVEVSVFGSLAAYEDKLTVELFKGFTGSCF